VWCYAPFVSVKVFYNSLVTAWDTHYKQLGTPKYQQRTEQRGTPTGTAWDNSVGHPLEQRGTPTGQLGGTAWDTH